MAKEIKIRIFPDGHIEAETIGIKGKACRAYIPVLEELLNAEAVDSQYTAEYYEATGKTSTTQALSYEQQNE